MNLRQLSLLTFSTAALLLTGCGFTTTQAVTPGGASAMIAGNVHGGQQPVLGATVSVVSMGDTGYGSASTVLASVTSSLVDGSFQFPSGAYTCPYADTPVYLLAQGGDAGSGINLSLALAAGIGPCSTAPSQEVTINEVTTVATAYALGQFFTTTMGATDDFGAPATGTAGTYNAGLVMANNHTIPMLVNLANGTVNPNTATTTIEAAKIYSIANTIASCVNSNGAGEGSTCSLLFEDTTPNFDSVLPTDTLQAAVQMSLYPYRYTTALFDMGTPYAPFIGLSLQPNDFTIGVSYKTPTMGLGVSGMVGAAGTSSNIDIDTAGRVWFPSNLSTGVGIGYFDPASTSFGGPFNPEGHLVRPQYVAIDLNGFVWVTDQASGYAEAVLQDNPTNTNRWFFGNGSLSFYGGPIAVNQDGTLFWEEELTDGSAIYMVSLDPTYSNGLLDSTFTNVPTGMATHNDGQITDYEVFANTNGQSTNCNLEVQYYSPGQGYTHSLLNVGDATSCVSGGAASAEYGEDQIYTETNANEICSTANACFTPTVPLNAPEGIATDGTGSAWVANSGDGSISTLYGITAAYNPSSDRVYIHNSSNGATMQTPYGLAIDGSGNVWVSNAGCVTASTTPCTPTSFVLSELIGAAAPTITPLVLQASGTLTGTEPALKRSGPVSRVSPLLEQHPSGQRADTVPNIHGVPVP